MSENRPRMTRPDALLSQIIVKTKANHEKGLRSLAVFDLDSTLFDVSPRIQKVLDHYYNEPAHKQQFPQYSSYFENIKAHKTDWGIKTALMRAGLQEASLEFMDSVRNFWRKNFFSNDYLEFDNPFEGAVEFVNELHKLGAEVAYLTGRDVHRMGPGSEKVLKKWGFPLADNAKLYLKPHLSMEDVSYKEDWFHKIDTSNFANIWFFENEPVIIQDVRKSCPFVEIIFFDSTHSGRAEPPHDLPRIQHFNWKK